MYLHVIYGSYDPDIPGYYRNSVEFKYDSGILYQHDGTGDYQWAMDPIEALTTVAEWSKILEDDGWEVV